MNPNLNPSDDSHWVVYPPPAKRTARQRFIYRAADHYGLTSKAVFGLQRRERVSKSFHEAMQNCPLPENVDTWSYQPTAEDFFLHLVVKRLDGAALPVPLETFQPS